MLAGAIKPRLGPRAGWGRLERFDQFRGALTQSDEADAELVELGEVLLGGELLVEHQQLGQLAVRFLVEATELDHLA